MDQKVQYDWMNPLLTDNYQITMAYAEWKAGRHNEHCIFEMFFRKCPFNGKYAIFTGHDEVFEFLKTYKFTQEHLNYLKNVTMPHAEQEFFDYLGQLNCESVKVYGATDGEIVFPDQPLLRLEGPFALLQLIETPILNLTNFPTLLCTNATRMKLIAGKSQCVEFGLRRAQGPSGAMIASKYSYVGGFNATSNVYSGFLNGIPVIGTQAHSFIMSFEKEQDIQNCRILKGVDLLEQSLKIREELGWQQTNLGELYAFISYAHAYPNNFSSLVDSYSTLNSGLKNFLIVALVLKSLGFEPVGIRLDSGDLAQLSKDCKKQMIEIGSKYGYDFSKLRIVVSNDINEITLNQFNEQGHEIDVFGIGTNLVTCQAQPALGMVYKVVEFQGTARMKLSEEISKITLPGPKSVLRIYDEANIPLFDLLCTPEEVINEGADLKYYIEKKLNSLFQSIKPFKIEAITKLLYEKSHTQNQEVDIKKRREKVLEKLEQFKGNEGLILDKKHYPVYYSEKVYNLFCQKYNELKQIE